MIKYIRGNVLQKRKNYDVIAHGVNCSNVFAMGFCEQVRHMYPRAKIKYHEKTNNKGWDLGDVQMVKVDFGYVANCGTQLKYKNYINEDDTFIDYRAFELCMKKLHNYCHLNDKTIAIPRIGSGRAGGNWKKLESIVEKVFHNYPIHIYYN